MRKLLLSLALLMFASPISAYANEDKAPAVTLDGTQYLGFYSVDVVELEPDPEGDFNLPIYMHFVEQGGVVYGCAVVPGYVEDQFAPPQSVLGFRTWPLYDGSWAGNKLIIQSEEEQNEPIKRLPRFAKGGKLLKIPFNTDSGKMIFKLTRCNADGSYVSGMYLGSVEQGGGLT